MATKVQIESLQESIFEHKVWGCQQVMGLFQSPGVGIHIPYFTDTAHSRGWGSAVRCQGGLQ